MRALDLVRDRLPDVVQDRGALRRLHVRVELGRHQPDQVDDLERVLEHVLPVARPVVETAEQLDDLLVELAAVGLEDRLLARLDDVLLDLGLGLVVHLLDAGRLDAAVLDELEQRDLRDLAADRVERREHDRLGRVVDDHVHAGQVLERADVASLAADDPPLHVVGRELDQRRRRLRCVARGNALERVGDEVPGASLRLGLRLLVELAHPACEVVADELLGLLEEARLRLVHGHAGDALELRRAHAASPP